MQSQQLMPLEMQHHINAFSVSKCYVNVLVKTPYNASFMHLVTSDVQSVSATITGESTIRIQCLFIRGSDAIGCKVLLVSNCFNSSDVHINITKIDAKASEQLNLPQNALCYHKLIAFDIEFNNTISDLGIEGSIESITSDVHAGNT